MAPRSYTAERAGRAYRVDVGLVMNRRFTLHRANPSTRHRCGSGGFRPRELGGTGLGLAIVKHIVQAHGGWMRIESELNRGTTVSLYLPAASFPEASSPLAREE